MKSSKVAVAVVVALSGLSVGVVQAGAQSVSTPPFHGGQWGVEAYATQSSGGLLRFLTPRLALVLSGAGVHETTKPDDSPIDGEQSHNEFTLALGLRHYAIVAPKTAVTVGGGLSVGTEQQKIDFGPIGGVSSYRSYEKGAYAELGGEYLVTDHFGVGLSYRFAIQRATIKSDGLTSTAFATAFMPIRATLYF